jgi:DNA-binding HxlR family transcriptional regulator
MGSSANQGYCAFTKAVEHLGDRWSFLIVRELAMFGPQGFNTLAAGLPGRVSRSVLVAKLRKLEDLGLVMREPTASRTAPYRLAPAGAQLVPTLKSLWDWAEHWVPEDAAMAERDPTVIAAWLENRVDPASAPEQQAAIELAVRGMDADRVWLLVARGTPASLCRDDPLLDSERYVYVEADARELFPIARGLRSWADGIADGSVQVYGDPALVAELPGWFLPVESVPHAETAVAAVA